MNSERRASFTLIELLIVIGIVAILATVTLLVLNPAEMLKQGRDGNRLAEIASLDKTINFAISQIPPLYIGSSSVVYISIPDTATNCPNISSKLPALAAGWSYHCASEANFRKIDGTGWLPVNFQSGSIDSFSKIPVDPRNNVDAGLYYSYATRNGRWEFNADMESTKYKWGGARDVESPDGGNTIVLYEKGSDLTAMPKEANWRVGYIARISESCANQTTGTNYGDQFEFYNRWSSGVSGQAAVVKLMFFDDDGSFNSGESLAMAVYNDGNPDYSKLSEDLTVVGAGYIGWVSSTLATPIGIRLENNYVLGLALSDSSMDFSNTVDFSPLCSPPTTGPGQYYVNPSDQLLNSVVPTALSSTGRTGFVGIMYSL